MGKDTMVSLQFNLGVVWSGSLCLFFFLPLFLRFFLFVFILFFPHSSELLHFTKRKRDGEKKAS